MFLFDFAGAPHLFLRSGDDFGRSGGLIARSETAYDARGRLYRQTTYAVDPASGTAGNALVANTWYDLAGNVIKYQPAGVQGYLKVVYDSLGRVVTIYAGFAAGETAWEDACSAAGDTIVQQGEILYDAADNFIAVTQRARLHTATDEQRGPLQTLTGADPQARVNYLAYYYGGWHWRFASVFRPTRLRAGMEHRVCKGIEIVRGCFHPPNAVIACPAVLPARWLSFRAVAELPSRG